MIRHRIAALALAGAFTLTATSASAYWRGGYRWGPGIAFGLAAGALIGSAVAARPYYYGPAYVPAYYAPTYYVAPPTFYSAPVALPYGYGPSYGYYGYYGYRTNCGGSYGQRRDCAAGDTAR